MEDIYVASRSAGTQFASKQAKRSRVTSEEPLGDFIWPLQEEEFVITLQKMIGTLHLYNHTISRMIVFLSKKTRAKDDQGKTLDIPKRRSYR